MKNLTTRNSHEFRYTCKTSAIAGGLIGLAGAVKLFPLFLLVYFAIQRRWLALSAGAMAFALTNLLALAVLGTEPFFDYILQVVPAVGEFRDYWLNASIAGYWSKLLDGSSGHVEPLWRAPLLAKLLTAASCLVVVLVAARQAARAKDVAQRDLAFSLCIVAMLLISPIAWDHYFLLLLVPMVALWRWSPATLGRRALLLGILVTLVTVNPRWIWDLAIPGDGELVFRPDHVASVATPIHSLTVISYPFYGLLALFGMIVCVKISRNL